jgi:hypothetical protein
MIAVERFLKILKPFEWQIKASVAKMLCVASVILATMVSWPAIVIYGKDTFDIPKFNLTGSACKTDNNVKDTSFPVVYTLALAILFICSVILLVILYCMIGNNVRSRVRNMKDGLVKAGSQAYIRRTTFVMYLVTIAFICSFLPHLIVRQFKSKFTADGSSSGSEGVYKILTRSYFLNCAVNPIIYSIFDSHFRRACKRKASGESTTCTKAGA